MKAAMRTYTNRAMRAGGFTLVEMAIVMLIVGIISYVIAAGFLMSSRTMKTMERRSDVSAFLQEAVERTVDTLRSASSIVAASPSSITAVVSGSQMTIAYDSTAKTITRNGAVIGANISAFAISYFDAAGNPTTIPGAVRSATFVINGISGNEPWRLETTVSFRKLRLQV